MDQNNNFYILIMIRSILILLRYKLIFMRFEIKLEGWWILKDTLRRKSLSLKNLLHYNTKKVEVKKIISL